MQKRTLKVALLAVLSLILVLGMSTVAFADQTWTDLPDTVTAKYGITDNQVSGISEGFNGGLWKPYQPVTRAQFTKMAVAAFNIPLADPATASFTDVPKGSFYYPYVEGAKAAGAVNGTTATTFSPNANITRQQAVAIVARYVAKAQGFDLATMYTADELAILLAHFGDAASISADLKAEVAFAYDMGLTTGDDYGNFNPLANLTRIQAAAFLIRAQGLVPPQLWIPAKIELVSADKTEGLIGQTYSATFEVTDAAGHPAIGVLVDFDTQLVSDFYVGNVSPEAAVTNNYGQVTVNLLSLEPGTQRLSATVAGVGTIYTTRYWLALDEVYATVPNNAQNNAGVEHQYAVRVVVFGPGPRSTSASDWYNAISMLPFDPTDLDVDDGVDYGDWLWNNTPSMEQDVTLEPWSIAVETDPVYGMTVNGFKPRTMAGIDVEWAIYDRADNPLTATVNEKVTSVGNIINVDGTAITPARTAVGKTNAEGVSTIKVYSEQVGKTLVEAVADYAQNPYPEQLFNHWTFEQDDWWHSYDWDDQPSSAALFQKTWISHTIGTTAGPIAPAYQAPNVGEEKTLTITLVDVYGNPVAGKSVEWFMQGVGFFNTDDSGDTSDPEVAGNNVDYDVTNAAGKATVFVKSYDSGEQIIHAKVRDKGTGGAEGTWTTYTAEVQWFDVDIATFDDITTQWVWVDKYVDVDDGILDNFWMYQNEAWSSNAVNASHTFTISVYGVKLEYDPSVDYPDGQTPFIDSDYAGSSYDGIFNWKDATYFGGLMMVPMPVDPFLALDAASVWFDDKLVEPWGYEFRNPTGARWFPFDGDQNGKIENKPWAYDWNDDGDTLDLLETGLTELGSGQIKVAGQWLTLSFEGAYTQYDYDDDAYPEWFAGLPGIYLPLAGKTVNFSKANEDGANLSNLGTFFDSPAPVAGVGTITPPLSAVTDAAGKASVAVTATVKGPETVKGVVDWAGNPHNGPELVSAFAKKNWTAGTVGAATDVTIEIWIDGVKVATNKQGELAEASKAAWFTVTDEYIAEYGDTLPNGAVIAPGDLLLNSAHVEVHVKDAYGNDLPDYEVVYLLEDIDGWMGGSQNAAHTYIPFAYLADLDPYNDMLDAAGIPYDTNGPAPDADEPTPASDPYAYIVGDGDTPAFFFNQWLGSEKGIYWGQPGLADWYTRVPNMGLEGYYADLDHAGYNYLWPRFPAPVDPVDFFSGMDTVLEAAGADYQIDFDNLEDVVGLATDGAKAWTLDGYFFNPRSDIPSVIPNLLTGSNLDIQLADDVRLATAFGIHLKSILRVMVYAPADGLVEEGEYLWSYQVHQTWEEPVPTTITLAPAADYAIAGMESQTVVATVLDQFGDPMPNVDVTFYADLREGVLADELLRDTTAPVVVTTDSNGNAAITWGDLNVPGNWGVERVYAFLDTIINFDSDADTVPDTTDGMYNTGEKRSNASIIQWIRIDDVGADPDDPSPDPYQGYQITAIGGDQKVTVLSGFPGWNGDTLRVYLNPGGNVAGALGSATYVSASDLTISTNLITWITTQPFFVNAATSTDTDEVPNWVYDIVE